MNRPLVWVAVAMFAGVLLAAFGVVSSLAAPIVLLVAAALCTAVRARDPRIRPIVVALGFVGLGAALWRLHLPTESDPLSDYIVTHPKDVIAVEGVVRSAQLAVPGEDHLRFIVDVDRLPSANDARVPITGRTVVHWTHGTASVFPGERVSIEGKPRVAIAEVNPGVSSYETYLRNYGVHSAIDSFGMDMVKRTGDAPWYSPWYWAARLRDIEARKLAVAMPQDVLPFVYAIWLGHQSALRNAEYQDYVRSGTAHVLSVSGVHASIVALTLGFCLRVVQLGRRARAIAVMTAVFAFAFVSGASVPALRAAIMVCLYLSADLLEREPDTPTALSMAGIVFMIWDPRSVFDVGFQLSFASVASILIFAPPLSDFADALLRGPAAGDGARRGVVWNPANFLYRMLRGPAIVALAVLILPLPIAAATFHVFPLAGPAINLLVIPLLGIVLWLCFATTCLSFVWLPAAHIAGYATQLPVWLTRTITHGAASYRLLSWNLTTPTLAAQALFWGASALLVAATMVRKERRKRTIYFAAIALFLSVIVWRPRGIEPEVVMLDVGHGDASFVHMPTGETLLIDGGDADDYVDRGQQIVAPFLWARGVTRLDAVLASHSERDHMGGLLHIVDNFRVETAILGAVETERPLERAFLARCAARGTRVVRVKTGDSVQLGSVMLDVLHPESDVPTERSANNISVVARVPFGPTKFLFTGDVEKETEAALDPSMLHADVLKVPHHGADTSSTPAFIDAVHPQYATISTGSHGRRVMDAPIPQRYESKRITVVRTDRLGAIRFTLRGEELHVESERERRGYPIAQD